MTRKPEIRRIRPHGAEGLGFRDSFLVSFDSARPTFLQLFRGWHLKRTDDTKADPLGVRVIPDALGQLRVLHFPGAIGAAAGGAAAHRRLVVPRAAAHRMRVSLGGPIPWINGYVLAGAAFIEIRVILIEDPFDDIAIDIVEAPGIRLFFSDLLILEVA